MRQHVVCRLVAGVLLLFHACVILYLIPRWSVTYNEPGHISAGLACWYNGDVDLYRVNPPLPRMVATVPLLNQPGICLEALTRLRGQPGKREYEIGKFFADTNALDFHQIVCRARLAGVFWITLGGVVVWRWADSAFGPLGGLLALALWTFEPTLTAHAALATADVPATGMGLVATYAFAYVLRTATWFHTYVAGVLLGCALLCKFTLLLLPLSWAIIWILTWRHKSQYAVHAMSAGKRVARVVAIGFLAWLTLNVGYGFSGIGTSFGKLGFGSKCFGALSNRWISSLPCPVPTAYICGIDTQQRDFEGGMISYLRGESRDHGWWYYYLYAFGVKSPLGCLAIYGLAVAMIVILRVPISPLLWTFPVLIAVVASTKTGFTNHLRYMLPVYPYIMIMSGAVMSNAIHRLRISRNVFVVSALLCSAVSVSCTYPNLIGYFNEVVGGSSEGWQHLGDSNVDWGQDWIFLRDWIAAHPDMRPIHISLINHVDKQLYLRQQYPLPRMGMSGYAVVDAQSLIREYQWLLAHRIVARIGTSIFVFEVRP